MDFYGLGTLIFYFFVSLVITVVILIYYTNKDPLTWYNYFTVGGCFWLCFFIVFFLIEDISSGLNRRDEDAPTYAVVLWYIISIIILILAYGLIPYFQIFTANGQFNIIVRSLVSVLYNIAFFICSSCLFVIGLILLLIFLIKFAGMGEMDFGEIVKALYNFSMACSMGFGVVIFIFFLSYGISLAPRTLWNKGNLKRTYTHYCFKLAKLSPQIEKHREKLLRTMATIGVLQQKYKEANEPKMGKLIEKLYNKSMKHITEYDLVVTSGYLNMSKKGIVNTFCNPWKLGVLNGRLRSHLRHYKCDLYLWNKYLKKALFLEDVLRTRKNHFKKMRIVSPLFRYRGLMPLDRENVEENEDDDEDEDDDGWSDGDGEVTRTPHHTTYRRNRRSDHVIAKTWRRVTRCFLRVKYFLEWFNFFFIMPIFWRCVAVLMFFVYVILVWCELNPFLMSISPELNLSPISYLLQGCRSIEPLTQLINFVALSVITGTTVYGLFKFKIFRKYILIPHHSDASSMLFLCVVFCRVVIAICFNYIQLAGVTKKDGIAYFDIMITMDGLKILWIGKWIISFIPLLIVLLIIIFFFDVLDRLAELCGIERFSFTFSEKNFYVNMNTIKEGLVILEGERKRRLLEMRSKLKHHPDFIEEERRIEAQLLEGHEGDRTSRKDEREGFVEQSYVEKFVDLVIKPKRNLKWLTSNTATSSPVSSTVSNPVKERGSRGVRKDRSNSNEFMMVDSPIVQPTDLEESSFRAYDEL